MNRISWIQKEMHINKHDTFWKKISNLKNFIILILALIIVFLVFNYKIILWLIFNISWNYHYNNLNYTWSLNYHNLALDNLNKEEIMHNIWNDLYKIWELQDNTEEKIEYYKKSLLNYERALNKKENKDTRENYEFVKNKLDELLSKEEENKKEEEEREKEEDNKEDESNEDKEKEKEDNKDESNEEEKNKENNEADKENEDNEISPQPSPAGEGETWKEPEQPSWFTEKEKKQLDDYIEKMKKEEQANQKFFNKKPDNNIDPNDFFFDNYIKDPFFENIIDKDWEKDW